MSLRVNVAATLPALPWIAAGLLAGGVIFLIGGIALIAVPLRLASRNFRLPGQAGIESGQAQAGPGFAPGQDLPGIAVEGSDPGVERALP